MKTHEEVQQELDAKTREAWEIAMRANWKAKNKPTKKNLADQKAARKIAAAASAAAYRHIASGEGQDWYRKQAARKAAIFEEIAAS